VGVSSQRQMDPPFREVVEASVSGSGVSRSYPARSASACRVPDYAGSSCCLKEIPVDLAKAMVADSA
jgi:hypothetical protein